MEQDTGKYRINKKDQFYTSRIVAKKCVNDILSLLPDTSYFKWIEPSAGNGVFLDALPKSCNKIGLDIDPKSNNIVKQDFLTWKYPNEDNIIIFGNPPFGRQSSLAKKFIKKSCKFANVIAFILPKSFVKPSMNNSFDLYFHCIYSKQLDKKSFILNGNQYDVPCVFQIWEKKDYKRKTIKKLTSLNYNFVKYDSDYHIVIRRVGFYAGKCFLKNNKKYNRNTHYFILLDKNILPFLDIIKSKINEHIFPSNTVGARSLSKNEIIFVLNNIISSIYKS